MIGLATAALLSCNAGGFRLLGLDESIYSHVAREAALAGHWLPLTWEGHPFIGKPPLGLWLMGLSAKIFGPSEWALRLPSALAGGLCVAYSVALGDLVLGSLAWGLGVAVALLGCQLFILFGRVGNLDMALAACFTAALYHALRALRSDAAARSQALMFGVWVGLSLLIKSWVGIGAWIWFVALLAPRPQRGSLILAASWGPLLALAAWWLIYASVFGWAMIPYEVMNGLLLKPRVALEGAGSSLERVLAFVSIYGEMGRAGMAYLWPFLPLGLLSLFRAQSRGLLVFGLGYALAFTTLITPQMNYLLPLLPLAALAAVACFWQARQTWGSVWALILAVVAALWAGARPLQNASLPLFLSMAAPLGLLFAGPSFEVRRALSLSSALAWALAMGLASSRYIAAPPDPNREVVLAVLEHPARSKGERLLFEGDHVTCRVLRFYSAYDALAVAHLPKTSLGPAMLRRQGSGAEFFRASESLNAKELQEFLKRVDYDIMPGAVLELAP